MIFLLSLVLSAGPVTPQQCGPITSKDFEGPFFVPEADLEYETAPANEIADSTQAVVLTGQVLDRNCQGIEGATVEIWYAGFKTRDYTFRPEKLWYRGKALTKQNGVFQFLGTFPGTYDERPITHYHFKVNSPGQNGKSLTTQAYFRDRIPAGYENYARTRGTQFAEVKEVGRGGVLVNGGRVVTFNIKMDVGQFGIFRVGDRHPDCSSLVSDNSR
eukprot:TRINITY_DN10167_c0_g1_i1.p2 TRINITY_DN10167_c0_g1~~TRINITY_DN10167_c0_g1_i1.p2  ORF type:complete len:216 (-),score=45.37 TRINITY_DN10167_c0_g1_i1:160-807(-)